MPAFTVRLRRMRAGRVAILLLAALVIADAAIVLFHWPYTRERVVEGLQHATGSDVQSSGFRRTFFPHPGCVFENITFARSDVRLAIAGALKVEGSWLDVVTFRRHIDRMRVEALHVRIPPDVPPAVHQDGKKHPETIIGELVADGAVLEVVGRKRLLHFEFPHLATSNLAKSQRIGFATTARIPEPPGIVTTSGTIGPWRPHAIGDTPLHGSFDLRDGNLGHYEGISGLLAGNGSFGGTLSDLAVRGNTVTSNFRITHRPNTVRLEVAYDAKVNALTGDVTLESARAQFLRTIIHARGGIVRGTTSLDFDTGQARIQDLLRMFATAEHPALNGPIAFRAHTVLPPGSEPFLKKLRLDGIFGIDDGKFSKPATQEKVNELSGRARGHAKEINDGVPPESVVSDVKGQVALRQGLAHLSGLTFRVPGATARGGGTYSLITKQINLSGMLTMAADLPATSTGIKSVLLKPLSWMFDKKKGPGSVVPVRMTGVYPHPEFHMSLIHKK